MGASGVTREELRASDIISSELDGTDDGLLEFTERRLPVLAPARDRVRTQVAFTHPPIRWKSAQAILEPPRCISARSGPGGLSQDLIRQDFPRVWESKGTRVCARS